jgi:hypothetical protein
VYVLTEGISRIEDAVALALAADEYLIEPLKSMCALLIEKLVKVDHVWNVLNAVSHSPDLSEKCKKVKYLSYIQ